MPTTDELKAAPRATVVELSAWPGRSTMWELHHYEHGQGTGMSVAVHKDLHSWLSDLEAAGYLIGFGWEIRGQDAPEEWPGWPVEESGESDG